MKIEKWHGWNNKQVIDITDTYIIRSTTSQSNCLQVLFYSADGLVGLWGYHPPSSQCIGTDMVYYIYFWNLPFLNNVIIIKTKVLLPPAKVILVDLKLYCLGPLVLLLPKLLNYLTFQWFDVQLMIVRNM